MGKPCSVYKVPCACITCIGVECALSPKTRGEAEILRGVRLSTSGQVIEEARGNDPAVRVNDSTPPSATPGAEKQLPPPPLPESKKKPEVHQSILLRSNAPATKRIGRDLSGPVVLIGGAILCALVIVTGSYFLIEHFRPKPVSVLQEEVAQAIAAPTPLEGARPEEVTPMEKPVTMSINDVMASLNRPAPSITDLPPAPRTEELVVRVKQMKEEGNALVKKGNFVAAREVYQSAVQADPLFYEGWNNLANTYNDQGLQSDAEPIYRRGLEIEPTSPSLHFNLGNSNFRAAKYQAALTEFEFVLNKNPNDVDAHQLAGVSLFRLGNYADAAKHFQTVTIINPENADAFYNLALSLRRQGQDALAAVYYRDALRLNPELRTFAKN